MNAGPGVRRGQGALSSSVGSHPISGAKQSSYAHSSSPTSTSPSSTSPSSAAVQAIYSAYNTQPRLAPSHTTGAKTRSSSALPPARRALKI